MELYTSINVVENGTTYTYLAIDLPAKLLKRAGLEHGDTIVGTIKERGKFIALEYRASSGVGLAYTGSDRKYLRLSYRLDSLFKGKKAVVRTKRIATDYKIEGDVMLVALPRDLFEKRGFGRLAAKKRGGAKASSVKPKGFGVAKEEKSVNAKQGGDANGKKIGASEKVLGVVRAAQPHSIRTADIRKACGYMYGPQTVQNALAYLHKAGKVKRNRANSAWVVATPPS